MCRSDQSIFRIIFECLNFTNPNFIFSIEIKPLITLANVETTCTFLANEASLTWLRRMFKT